MLLVPALSFADLSDRLPRSLVEQMVKNKTWSMDFDDDSHPKTRDVAEFLGLIEGQNSSTQVVIQNLFSNRNKKVTLSETYPVKTQILRYYADHKSTNFIQKVKNSWIKEYTNTILSLIKVIGGSEYTSYVKNFENAIVKGDIRVEDLSEGLRNRLAGHGHGHSSAKELLNKDKHGNFTVSGVYNKERNIFAIDLARRSMEETIVTFVHEMIHASDTEVKKNEAIVIQSLPQVVTLLSKKTGENQHLSFLALDEMRQFFFEGNLAKIDSALNASEQAPPKSNSLKLNSNEEQLVRQWIKALIRTTVLNEYHAYGLSLKFLYKLNNEIDLVFGNVESYKKIIKRFANGDDVFIAEMGYLMNPFQSMKSMVLRSKKSPAQKSTLAKIANDLENIYVEELERYRDSNKGYSNSIKLITLKERQRGQVDAWMDDLSLPTNPYQILTAKITTAWIYRFKENIELVNKYFMSQNSSLVALSFGVLDLHDVNQGELKLIGVQWEDSKFQNVDDEVSDLVKMDLDLIPQEIKEYFQLYQWSPSVLEDHKESSYISADAVIANLLRLKLLKLSIWFDNNFEAWKHSLVGSKVFVEKLRSGIYVNPEDIDDARSRELEDELIEILRTGDMTKDEVANLEFMLKGLLTLYKSAEGIKWSSVSSKTIQKVQFIERMLEGVGVYGSDKSSEDSINEVKDAFQAQLSKYKDYCKSNKDFYNFKGVGQFKSRDDFSLNGESFKLMLTCNNKELYAVRQPGDFTRYMTLSFSNDKRLAAKIFKGSRKIILAPVNDSRSQEAPKKKKKGFFGLF